MSKFAVVDVETTGFKPDDRIIEIAIVQIERGEIRGAFSSLVDPGIPLPPEISDLTGIQPADIEGAPTFADISEQLAQKLDSKVLVAHNAPFDYRFLQHEFDLIGRRFKSELVCTVQLSRQCLNLQSYKLSDVADAVGVPRGRHRALSDAVATARIFLEIT